MQAVFYLVEAVLETEGVVNIERYDSACAQQTAEQQDVGQRDA